MQPGGWCHVPELSIGFVRLCCMGIRRWAVEVSARDRAQLEAWLRTQTIARALAVRAQIVLGSAAGESIRALGERLKVTQRTVCLWRRRYASQGLDGLRNRPRAGRPRRITSTKEQAVVSATLRQPKNATHWSARRLAKEVGLSKATVHRIWQKYGLQPHRVETFKFSRDPQFDRKLADIVGLYLDPPERALGCAWMKSRRFRRSTARKEPCRCGPDCQPA